jgi:F420-dependent oxidoreductase-like protein
MTIGIAIPAGVEPTGNAVDTYVDLAREAAAVGLGSLWFAQRFDVDALSLAAIVGSQVDGIAIGTSVVPIYPRHPIVVANQANTAQAASHGRFTLGLGLGAPTLVEPAYGVDTSRSIRHLREYLTVLDELFDHGSTDFKGDTLVARTPRPTTLAGATRPSILVAAMGPQALRVTGELADGTLPNLAGPRTLAEHIVPRITSAAERAGRPAPRIVAALAAVVTDDVANVRARLTELSAFYATIPSYRAVLEREGVTDPAVLAVVGDEAALAEAVARYRDAGATEIVLTQTALDGDESRRRTWAAAAALARQESPSPA